VEILEQHCPTYHIRDAGEFDSKNEIRHFNQWEKEMKKTADWLPKDQNDLKIALTSGASCPDVLVDEVMLKILSLFNGTKEVKDVIRPFEEKLVTEE